MVKRAENKAKNNLIKMEG
jgi:hypothetical protein